MKKQIRLASVAATALLAFTAGPAVAQSQDRADRTSDRMQSEEGGDRSGAMKSRTRGAASDWSGDAISAAAILEGNFSNGMNPVGQVKSLILDENASRIAYVVYETNHMPWEFYIGDGYVSYNAVDLRGAPFGEVSVIGDASEEVRGPEELQITADEAPYRLVSQIIDNSVTDSAGASYDVTDLMVAPDTGEIVSFVVEDRGDSYFSGDSRTIPARAVSVRSGELRFDGRIALDETAAR